MHCQVSITAFAVSNLISQAANIKMCRCSLYAHNGVSLADMSNTISDEVVSRLKVLDWYLLQWNCKGKPWIDSLVLWKWKMKFHCNNVLQTLRQHDIIRPPSYFLVLLSLASNILSAVEHQSTPENNWKFVSSAFDEINWMKMWKKKEHEKTDRILELWRLKKDKIS